MKKLILIVVLFLTVSTVYSQSSSITFADHDSLGSAADTLSRMDTAHTYNDMYHIYKQHFQFWAICDSAFYISTVSTFPANKTRLIRASEPYLSPLYTIDINNFYFKTVGTGKAILRREQWGF